MNKDNIAKTCEGIGYESIVSTMKTCLKELRKLGNGDSKKIREITSKSLIDSGFIDEFGRIMVPQRRSDHIEAFLNKIDAEYNMTKSNQRVRK